MYPGGTPPEGAAEAFGSVSLSMFSLFELMNGDMKVVMPVLNNSFGKVLFCAFVVIANWSILAILTSVVSEGMIRTSTQIATEEERTKVEQAARQHLEILLGFFESRDPEKTKHINEDTWIKMLEEPHIVTELAACTQLSKTELIDLFECLAVEEDFDGCSLGENVVNYYTLVNNLQHNSLPADKGSICHVMMRMRLMQTQMMTMEKTLSERISDNQKRISANEKRIFENDLLAEKSTSRTSSRSSQQV